MEQMAYIRELGGPVRRADPATSRSTRDLPRDAARGAYVIEPEPLEDERGFFARTWCAREFAAHGLETRIAQCSISFNAKRGTLRGMHYQSPPSPRPSSCAAPGARSTT